MANLGGDALSWFFTEDASFCRRTGGASLADDYEAFKRLFLQRYGTINSSQSYFELRNMKVGESESLLDFGQRLRDRIFDANVVDENVKITIFINSLEEPLKSQLTTRLPATFDQAVDEADFLSRRIQLTTTPPPDDYDSDPYDEYEYIYDDPTLDPTGGAFSTAQQGGRRAAANTTTTCTNIRTTTTTIRANSAASTSSTPFRGERSRGGIVQYSCSAPGPPPWRTTPPSTVAGGVRKPSRRTASVREPASA